MKWLSVTLLVAYPFLAHAAVWLERPLLQWIALVCLVSALLLPPMLVPRAWAWVVWAALGAGLYVLAEVGGGIYALYLPSLLIPGMLMFVFGSSLLSARGPLISRIAATQSGAPLPPPVARYTRLLTQLWTALFGFMILDSLVLASLDLMKLWSLMTNFVHYLLAGAFFVLEYPLRCWLFPDRQQPGFFAYLRKTASTDLRSQ